MKFINPLITLGLVLSFGWMYFYALPTASLVQQMLDNESYYLDITSMYLLPYAIAPFVAASYIEGSKQSSLTGSLLAKQWFTFVLLSFFASLQLFECAALVFAFISTLTVFELTIEWLWLLLPIGFFTFFILLVFFLFQTRHSLKSIQAA